MTVYLDIVFIENTLMNYIILITTAIICKEKKNQIRILISSILGSIYAVCFYITRFPIYISIISKIILSLSMIYIAFKTNGMKKLLKNVVIFFLTSFVFGGCAFAILYYLDSRQVAFIKGKFIVTYPIRSTVIGGTIGFIIINIALKVVKNKLNISDMLCNIKVFNNGREERLKAMIDTGNFLRDPITNTPVIIIEKDSLSNLLPSEILENTTEIINGEYEIKNGEYLSKLRILPFSSLGKKNGMLLGIKVDKVEVELNDEKAIKEDTIIGICNNKLSNTNKYNCLLGLNYIENNV